MPMTLSPNDPDETADSDMDGVGDNADAFPMDATETVDTDGDGIGNNADTDDDGDGVADADDGMPLNSMETMDTDGDGVGDNADLDDDGDGVLDADDAFPLDGTETVDSDGDGVGDNADTDRDGDGVANADDAFPDNAMESADLDMDGVGDNADPDRDGDGVANANDAFPDDAMETADADMDGVGDNADTDDDNDGVADADDAFPNDPMESADSDGDGVGDNADTDRDGDGVADAEDAFPDDPMESADLDMDGVGDNADMDRDGDGVANAEDAFPDDAMETADLDMDGTGDNADTDDDGDGVADADDAFPRDAMESADLDGDGTGDNADTDRDGDGIANVADRFPDDATEWADFDNDGTGDNADALPFDPDETADADGDGVGDNEDLFDDDATEWADADGDGYGDNEDDAFPDDPDEWADSDMDGVGDNADPFPNHVIGLLGAANAANVEDDATTPNVDEQAQAVMAVAMAIGNAAGTAGTDADNNSSTTDGTSDSTATAEWPADTPDDPDTEDTNEFMAGMPSITVTRTSGTDLVFRTMAAEEDDTTTAEVDETIVTATKIDGLGDFMQGYSISDRGTHAIVFTDITQEEAAVGAVTLGEAVNIANKPAVASRIVLPETATDLSTAAYDHDGDPDTNALPGATLACGSAQATDCSFEIQGGMLTSLVGYVVSVSAAATFELAAAKAAVPDASYLAFGIWLDGDDSADNDGTGDPQIAAFANGATAVTADTYDGAAVTGTASYTGAAAGVYTAGSSVDYFRGRASLTADFGEEPETGDDTALGTITGMIDQIMVGGASMSDVINLNNDATPDDGNITATGGIAGDVRMGPGMTVDNVTTYTYNGTWSGQFYNGTADDADTADVDESRAAPGSVAGTFGVTGTMGEGDDAMTRSYVGAFGAHQQMDQ